VSENEPTTDASFAHAEKKPSALTETSIFSILFDSKMLRCTISKWLNASMASSCRGDSANIVNYPLYKSTTDG
jgi:hypothetical protein